MSTYLSNSITYFFLNGSTSGNDKNNSNNENKGSSSACGSGVLLVLRVNAIEKTTMRKYL